MSSSLNDKTIHEHDMAWRIRIQSLNQLHIIIQSATVVNILILKWQKPQKTSNVDLSSGKVEVQYINAGNLICAENPRIRLLLACLSD